MHMNAEKKVSITGYGSISAAGENSSTALANLLRGQAMPTMTGGEFFPGDFIAPCFQIKDSWIENSSHVADIPGLIKAEVNRTITLALIAIKEGLGRAGYELEELQAKRVGIALGTTVGCTFHNEEYYKTWSEGGEPDRFALTTYLKANLSARIQEILQVHGPRVVITNACASGTDAIGVAKTWLQQDICDVAIAGGADELSRIACHGFKSLMLVSDKVCTPFDRNRKGLNLGEGAGVFVMESVLLAQKRGVTPHGYVLGYGIAGDAYHPTAPHPEARGLQLAIRKAMAEAGIQKKDIAMINAHGTGTPANDQAETGGLTALGFSDDIVPVVSTKGVTGHTLGAAGGVEAVFALMALNTGQVAGTVGCSELDPAFTFAPIEQGNLISLKGRIGLSQSLAFGGSNAALVLEGRG